MCMLSCFSCVRLFATLWTVAYDTLLSMGILQAGILKWVAISFSRGASQSRIKPASLLSPAWAGRFSTDEPLGKPLVCVASTHFPWFFFSLNFLLCVLAWRIPETEEPGVLPSMGSQSRTRLKRLSSSSSSSRADLQCCDSFSWTGNGLSHTYTCIHSPPNELS